MKKWHYREFRSLTEAVTFSNERNIGPTEIIIGPINRHGFIEAMYFTEEP